MFKSLQDLVFITEYTLDVEGVETKLVDVQVDKHEALSNVVVDSSVGSLYKGKSRKVLFAKTYELKNGMNKTLINEYSNFDTGDPVGNHSEMVLVKLLQLLDKERELIRYDRDSVSTAMYLNYKLYISVNYVNDHLKEDARPMRKQWLDNGYVIGHRETVKKDEIRMVDTKGVRVAGGKVQPRWIVVDPAFIKKHKFEFNNQYEKEKVYI